MSAIPNMIKMYTMGNDYIKTKTDTQKGESYLRNVISLNGAEWKFKKDWVEIPAQEPCDWEQISLPHTWNAKDGQDGGNDYFRGSCVYAVKADRPVDGDQVWLEIEAASLNADVYVNGIYAVRHEGGYSAFRVDCTKLLKEKENLIVIRVDNSDNGYVYPQMADFTFYGGLYRNVSFITVPETHFDLDYYASPGVICSADLEYAEHVNEACVTAKAWVKNPKEGDLVQFTIYNADGHVVAVECAEASEEVVSRITIGNPHLWNGTRDPYLYKVTAQLIRNEEYLDQVTVPLGIRTFSVDSQKGFLLNGECYPLRGVSRHQDKEGIGNALSREDMRMDAELIREVGANTVRLAHYQHSRYFYDLCDRMGLVVWAEIPFISSMNTDPRGHENCISQLKELIYQNYNHPSICFWGIANELTLSGETSEMEKHLRELNDLAHEIDPTRLTTIAQFTGCPMDSRLNTIMDTLGYNHYFGWYTGSFEDNEAWLDSFHEKYPQIPLGVSEYGCESVTKYHSENPQVKDYTEEYQALYHEHMMKVISERPWLWATYVWNMFDFAADGRDEGGVKGRNNKGLVTMDRKIKKDSYYLYKAYWSKEPFIHICGSRFVQRTVETVDVKVYSNLPELALFLDGKVIDTEKAEKVFVFRNVPLRNGKNTITVKSAKSGLWEDSICWERVKEANPEYTCPDFKENGVVRNWFEDKAGKEIPLMTFDPAYYSIKDNLGDILENDFAANMMCEAVSSMVGMEINRGMLAMGAKGSLEDMSVLLAMCKVPNALEYLNAELQKIKKQTSR